MYAQENDEKLPTLDKFWTDIAVPAAILICPTKKTLANGYVFNRTWSGCSLGEMP